MLAIQLRELDGLNAVPVTSSWGSVSDKPVTRTDVVQLLLSGLPIPSEKHSFEDVLDFRNEARQQGLTPSYACGSIKWLRES